VTGSERKKHSVWTSLRDQEREIKQRKNPGMKTLSRDLILIKKRDWLLEYFNQSLAKQA
jgi:hypothetical protein